MSLGSEGVYIGHPAREDESITPFDELKALVESQANYKSDWTLLLKERLLHPETKQKFFASKLEFPTTEARRDSDIPKDEPHDLPRDHFAESVDNYNQAVEDVFSSTGYMTAQEYNEMKNGKTSHQPKALGVSGGYRDSGHVFRDATYNGRPLEEREKNIIEAHEKLHSALARLTDEEKKHILGCIDLQKLIHKNVDKADEVLARMSQLKNYFGMKGGEVFTREHLEYARKHYLEDIGMDNNVGNLIASITPGQEDDFVRLMNKVVC